MSNIQNAVYNYHYQTGADFINYFAPCADLLRPAPNICTIKKLLKSWAQGAIVGRKGAKPLMESTPGLFHNKTSRGLNSWLNDLIKRQIYVALKRRKTQLVE